MIYNLKQDIDSLNAFQMNVTRGGYYGTWYVLTQNSLSDTTKNIIKSYGGDKLGRVDFENIIKILESIS